MTDRFSFSDGVLLENIDVFKNRVKYNVLSKAILDGGCFYSPETTEEYLKCGLSRIILIRWLKKNLPYDFGIEDGAEDEDLDYDRMVLELCQILKKYNFSTRTIEKMLKVLKEDARVFFLMNVTQQEEWQRMGINPEKFKNRCLKYPVEHYRLRTNLSEFKKVPGALGETLIKRMLEAGIITEEELLEDTSYTSSIKAQPGFWDGLYDFAEYYYFG